MDACVVDIVAATIDGGHAHDAQLVYLEAEVGTVQVLFNGLGGPEVVARLLVFGVFFQDVPVFDCLEFLLFRLERAVQIRQVSFLCFQLYVQ